MALSAAVFVFFLVIVAVILGAVIRIYNGLVALKFQMERAWANIDVLMKQRFDEVPQLIQIIEQFVQHEKSMVRSVVEARARYGSARTTDQKVQASKDFSLALQGVIAIGEAYPELKSNQNFMQLQSRLSELESHIADRRESFNEAVTNFNTRIEQLPDVFLARLLGYQSARLFEVEPRERAVPNLKMNLG